MLKLQRKSMLHSGSPTQKRTGNPSGDSLTEESSSFSFRDYNDFGDFHSLNPSQQRVVEQPSESSYDEDQLVRPKVALHANIGGLESFSGPLASELTKKKRKKPKQKGSPEAGKGTSKTKATPDKVKTKQSAGNAPDSPFWSLMETGPSLLSINPGTLRHSQTANFVDSHAFGEPNIRDDQSLVSNDGSILLPSKASIQANERSSSSPADGARRRRQRTKVKTATGRVLMPSKASLDISDRSDIDRSDRSEGLRSNGSSKKKRRPKQSKQSPTETQDSKLGRFLNKTASVRTSQSTPSASSRSQSSKTSRNFKSEKSASSDGSSQSLSPKPASKATLLPPAIEGKPSSFSDWQQDSFHICHEVAASSQEANKKSRMIQPSKASLESMLERVTIRKRTQKSSASSVGSTSIRRGKRPQGQEVSSDDSVVSLDTGMTSRKVNHTRRRPGAIPSRAVSYQSNVKESINQLPASVEGASIKRSKASLQKMLVSVKNRKTSASSVGSRSRQQSPQRASSPASNLSSPLGSRRMDHSSQRASAPASYGSNSSTPNPREMTSPKSILKASSPAYTPNPAEMTTAKSILKVNRRNSFENEISEPIEPSVVAQRRASFAGNSKHPSGYALASYGENSNGEATPASKQPTRRGVKSASVKIVGSKTSPTKACNQRSRSNSPLAKGKQASPAQADLSEDPWDNIDEAFMPITSAEQEEQAKKAKEETKRPTVPGDSERTPDDMWASLACVDTSNPSSSPKQREQKLPMQLTAIEVQDAWWNVDENNDQSLVARRKQLARRSILLVSTSKIPSMRSGLSVGDESVDNSNPRLQSPPPSAPATKMPIHTSMPMPSLEDSPFQSPNSNQRQSDSALPSSMGKSSAHTPSPTKSLQSEPNRLEVTNAWWAEDVEDKQTVAKKKQLARKSVLLVGSGHHNVNTSKHFDCSDDEEESEEFAGSGKDDGLDRRLTSGGRRTASQSPGRLATKCGRSKLVKQPAPPNIGKHPGYGSPQQRHIQTSYSKVADAFAFK